jgi:hypothetical protein
MEMQRCGASTQDIEVIHRAAPSTGRSCRADAAAP